MAALTSYLRGLVEDVVELSKLDSRVRGFLEGLRWGRAFVIAMGKGSVQMASGLEGIVEFEGGVIVKPRGSPGSVGGLEVIESSHPTPDESSLRAGDSVLEWARASRGGRLIVLVSGGASALVEKPLEPLTLDDVKVTTSLLLGCGATIHEINTVRKHISAVKGGRLAAEAYPGEVLGLYASDVPGDNLDVIGSGPTVADSTTFREALWVIDRYGLREVMPQRVLKLLEDGARGLAPETPKPSSPQLSKTRNELVAANIDVLRGLKSKLETGGFNTVILTSRLEGEAREVGKALASITLEAANRGVPVGKPGAILAGGETSVKVKGKGRGGRNMELAFSWALTMWKWGSTDAAMLSMDTDGIDGFTDAAGAIVTPQVIGELLDMKIDPYKVLDDNDTYTALEKVGALIKTGPTGTNLNSIQVILVA
ncbi:MAG: glycerate kinase [Thermoprotei archaeon]|nr:glycerate kinase [Thermoprotei archaeon]